MLRTLLVLTLLGVHVAAARAADPVFNPGVLHETRLVMDPADWRALRENYRENQYYSANVTIDGETVQQVGIRSRGAGSRNREKPGLKLDFNKYVQGQEFHGYKSMVLDNFAQDPSCLREHLAFLVFEAMGFPSPQNSFTRLYVNNEYWGLYGLVEPVSKPFLKARLGEESGNLFDYEPVSDYFFEWLGSDPDLYVPIPFQPETNEGRLDTSGLIAFIRAANLEPDETFESTIASFIDVDRLLRYVAVENALAEYDGFVGQYGMNNFYLYQYGGQNRFVLIPWDKDGALQEHGWPLLSRLEENVLIRRITRNPVKMQIYVDAVSEAVNSFVNPGWLQPKLDAAYALIRESVILDKSRSFSTEDFEIAVDGLSNIIETRQTDLLQQTR